MAKIFLTGSNGFIGREVLRLCDASGIEVMGVDMGSPVRSDCETADIRDPAIADLIPQDVDAVVHLAGLSRDVDCRDNAYSCFDINVTGTLNLIEASSARSAKQFIFASSEWVYDSFETGIEKTEETIINPAKLNSEYAFSKFTSEVNLRQKFSHGFCPVTILRFGIVYGERRENWSAVEAILNAVATHDEVVVGSLETGRGFVHVSDIARGVISAIGCPGFEIVNLQSPKFITIADVISAAEAAVGKCPPIRETDAENPSIRRVSGEKAERILSWKPDISIGAGVGSVAEYLGFSA